MRFVAIKQSDATATAPAFQFSLPLLMDIAFVLGEDYRNALRQLYKSIVLPAKEDCAEALDLFVETLHRGQRRFEKGGKTAAANSPIDAEDRDRMLYTLIDQTTRTWSSLVAVWPDATLAQWCLHCEDFALTLQSVYDGLLVPELNGSAAISADEWKLLKIVVLTLLYRVLDGVFRIEEAKKALQGNAVTTELIQELHVRLEKLCDALAPLLEQHSGPADGKQKALETAPFMADMDAVFNLSHIFELYIVAQVDQGSSNAPTENNDLSRIEFTLASLHFLAEQIDRTLTDCIFHGSTATPGNADGESVLERWPAMQQITTAEDLEYVARSSLITQVQELFPDFGDGFIDACLLHYDGDAERLISALCEGQLPPELEVLDRKMTRLKQQVRQPEQPALEQITDGMEKMNMKRRNVHDFDAFDVYHGAQLSSDQIHRGKKEYVSIAVCKGLTTDVIVLAMFWTNARLIFQPSKPLLFPIMRNSMTMNTTIHMIWMTVL
jgi:hypothetical protein